MSFSQNKNKGFRQHAGGKPCGCDKCVKRRKPKPVCVENCDPSKPLVVKLEEPINVNGCFQVDNKPATKLDVDVSGCLQVDNKPEQKFQTESKVFNTEECPVFAKVLNTSDCPLFADVMAEVEGTITVRTDPREPLCVQVDNKEGQTIKVDIGWNHESEFKVPVYGRFEVCNCCDDALLFESEQFKTTEPHAVGGETLPVGTNITDVIATLASILAPSPP